MLISLEWLNDFVDVSDRSADELSNILTMLGLEAVTEGKLFSGESLVVGHVLNVEKHPNADRLSVCSVDVGADEPYTIVCGAPNVAAGQRVPVALPGAVLPGDFAIKKAKIRGVESSGMICAEDELGLSSDHSGIMVLPVDATIGEPLMHYLHLDSERVKTDVTPNRGDSLSHLGTARDLSAALDRPLKRPNPDVVEEGPAVDEVATVTIDDPDGCPRYVARVVQNVTVGPSPAWLAGRLRQVGIRPINNVVDATNYVLMAVGHPLHAFDLDRVAGEQIIVRAAKDGEKFTTLDSVTRTMPSGTVMICDAHGPVGMAGIMGGENSEIRTTTTNVLLEAAYFNPARIRRTSKALGLSTEASQRFERGTDYENTIRAIDWCAELIRQIAGGRIARGRIDEYPTPQARAEMPLRWSQILRILGIDVPRDEVRRQMTALGVEILGEDESGLRLRQPSWRPDLTREVDIIEEVARLWGYDRIPITLGGVGVPATQDTPEHRTINDVRRWLVGMGLQEVVTSALVSRYHAELLPSDGSPIQLANSSSNDMSHLRTHMLPSLLEVARRNFAHKSASGISVFEIGAEYRDRDAEYAESRQIAIALTGKTPGDRWGDTDRQWDWYDLRGMIEQVIARCALLEPQFVSYDLNGYVQRTGVRIRIADDEVGEMGQVVPALCSEFDLTYPVFFTRLDLAALAAHRHSLQTITPLPRFPAVERDLALVVSETVSAGTVEEVVRKAGKALLERIVLFDVYRGAGLREGEKSLGFTMEFRASDRTLTDQEVDELVGGMVKAAEVKTGARVRT